MRKFALATLAVLALMGAAAQALPQDDWRLTRAAYGKVSHFQIGQGNTAGMAGLQATYVTGETSARYTTTHNAIAAMQRKIPLEPWHGQRVRVSLRLKPEGRLYGWTSLSLYSSDGSGLASFRRRTDFGGGEWEVIPFVLDVPNNAVDLRVDVGLSGEGRVWVDEVRLERVGDDVSLSNTQRFPTSPPGYYGCCDRMGDSGNASEYFNVPNPYAGWAQSTLTDMRNGSSLQH